MKSMQESVCGVLEQCCTEDNVKIYVDGNHFKPCFIKINGYHLNVL